MNRHLGSVTKWIAVSVMLFIASGYFAIFAFMSRFHLRDHGGDSLALEDMYVGTLFWLFPVGVLLLMWGLFFLQKTLIERDGERRLQRYKPGSVVKMGVKQVS